MENFQTAHLNQCMVRFGHLLPIIAVLVCACISGTILVQQQIVFELNLVPVIRPFTTTPPPNTTIPPLTISTQDSLSTIPPLTISTQDSLSTISVSETTPVITTSSEMTTLMPTKPNATDEGSG